MRIGRRRLLRTFLNFIDPFVFTGPMLAQTSKDTCMEIISKVLDLRLHGELLDRAGTFSRRRLFVTMRDVYKKLGKRGRDLVFTQNDELRWATTVDWKNPQNACFIPRVVTGSDGQQDVEIFCTVLNKRATFPRDILASDPGPFDNVAMNYSLKLAFLHTSKDKYHLQSLFPHLSRSLVRRLSEEAGAVAAVVAIGTAVEVAHRVS